MGSHSRTSSRTRSYRGHIRLPRTRDIDYRHSCQVGRGRNTDTLTSLTRTRWQTEAYQQVRVNAAPGSPYRTGSSSQAVMSLNLSGPLSAPPLSYPPLSPARSTSKHRSPPLTGLPTLRFPNMHSTVTWRCCRARQAISLSQAMHRQSFPKSRRPTQTSMKYANIHLSRRPLASTPAA